MAYKIVLFDDSCHQFISEDGGVTWEEGCTPGTSSTPAPNDPGVDPNNFGTVRDAWINGSMAINDGDYDTFLGVDFDYRDIYSIVGLSPDSGRNLTWTLIDPSPGQGAFDDPAVQPWVQYTDGAISDAAGTILLVPWDSNDEPFYPRISRDGGSTWDDVTGTGISGFSSWMACCFGSAASQIMYMKPSGTGIRKITPAYLRKSTDWGATWSVLTGGPDLQNGAVNEANQRLRCSADGQTVIMLASEGVLWVSQDAGSNWNSFDLGALAPHAASPGDACDCAITPDGQTIIAFINWNHSGLWPAVFVSTDGGSSFTDVSGNLVYPASAGAPLGGHPTTSPVAGSQCAVAPDGLGMVLAFSYSDADGTFPDGLAGLTLYAVISEDAGQTWTLRSFDADPYEGGSTLGFFTSAWMMGEGGGCPAVEDCPPCEADETPCGDTVETACLAEWPFTLLQPRSVGIFFVPGILGGGPALAGGHEQVEATANSFWRFTYADIPIHDRDQILKIRELEILLEGRAGVICLHAYEGKRAPWLTVGDPIVASAASAMAIGATSGSIQITSGGVPLPGMFFSWEDLSSGGTGGPWLYCLESVGAVSSGDTYAVTFLPPLRAAIAINDPLEFDHPMCRARLADDRGLSVELNLLEHASHTVDFEEDKP